MATERKFKNHYLEYARLLVGQCNLRDVLPHVDARSRRQVIFKIGVAVVMACGFFYQVGSFLHIYFQYPSTTDISITYPDQVPFPAIMICNNNGFRRTKYCETNEDLCFLSDRGIEVCESNEELCRNITFKSQYMFPKMENLGEESSGRIRTLELFGHKASALKDCHASWAPGIDFCGSEYLQVQLGADLFRVIKTCYLINSLIRNSPSALSSMPTFSAKLGVHYFSFIFDFETFEYFQPHRWSLATLSIFDPYTLVNPYRESLNAFPGKVYHLKLKPTQITLLEPPYPSQCKDYLKERKSFNEPTSRAVCENICIFQLGLRNCSCVPIIQSILHSEEFPKDTDFCPLKGIKDVHCTVSLSTKECLPKCPKECQYMTYDPVMLEEPYTDPPKPTDFHDPDFTAEKVGILEEDLNMYVYNDTNKLPYADNVFGNARYSKFVFELHKPELVVYRQKPKYESIELFSYVGGYMGMWLGMCLIMAWDLAEFAMLLLVYLVNKKKYL